MYAIVRAGGRQEKVAVGDVLTIDRVEGEPGTTLQLRALLLVQDGQVTSDATTLAGVTVTAEVVAATKGPKIVILKFKNKTGYRKRQGHRAKLTQVRVTGIDGPGIDRPGIDGAETETPVVETPVVETPAVETPAVETPAVETPAVETPVVEPSGAETPPLETLPGAE